MFDNIFNKLILIIICMISFSCTGKNLDSGSPQGVLSEYVSRCFSVKDVGDKNRLVEMATAEVKQALEKLDDETFKKYFITEKKQFLSLKIKDERKISDEKYSITYEITYMNNSHDSKDRITNKKHAIFDKTGGKWLISEVRNLRTSIEHQNELSF